MKILYAIQGTGNGHLSRARDIVPVLHKNHEVDILISGSQAEVEFPFPVKYRFRGLGFTFGANGGITLVETYCISLSHQAAVLNKKSPKPKDIDLIVKAVLKNYAPAKAAYGFHFKAYDEQIFTPDIRARVRPCLYRF